MKSTISGLPRGHMSTSSSSMSSLGPISFIFPSAYSSNLNLVCCFFSPLCPSALKPSRVLLLISPSVCDFTFCQQAQAAGQTRDSQRCECCGGLPESLVLKTHDPSVRLLMGIATSWDPEPSLTLEEKMHFSSYRGNIC